MLVFKESLFWSDRWIQGRCIQERAPFQFNAVGPRIVKCKTVAQGLENNKWVRDISGALTVQVILDFFLVWDATRAVQLRPDSPDKFLWKWTSDQCFSTASAYRAFFIGQYEVPGAKCLKKTHAPGKCKFFVWLVLHDRCWTAERRKRHNLQDDDLCALCAQESESISHLLLNCSFARQIGYLVLQRLRWHSLTPNGRCFDLATWWTSSRKKLTKVDRKAFDTLVILTSWMIWNERNRRTFDSRVKTVHELWTCILDEAVAWDSAGFKLISSFVVASGRRSLAL